MNAKYETFWRRFWAGNIDCLLLMPIDWIGSSVLHKDQHLAIVLIWITISYSVYMLYNILYHWRGGQTIGKKMMKIRVIDVSEEKGLTFIQAFTRDIVNVIFALIGLVSVIINTIALGGYSEMETTSFDLNLSLIFLVWFLVEILTMLTNKKRRALHDYIARTVVVKSDWPINNGDPSDINN